MCLGPAFCTRCVWGNPLGFLSFHSTCEWDMDSSQDCRRTEQTKMCTRELSTEAALAPLSVLGSPALAALSLAPVHYTRPHNPPCYIPAPLEHSLSSNVTHALSPLGLRLHYPSTSSALAAFSSETTEDQLKCQFFQEVFPSFYNQNSSHCFCVCPAYFWVMFLLIYIDVTCTEL